MVPTALHDGGIAMTKVSAFLNWLRDPFGNKKITERHTTIRRRMVETRTRTEDTTEFVRRYPIGHTLARRRKPRASPMAKGARP
jgi:hypothetical protein